MSLLALVLIFKNTTIALATKPAIKHIALKSKIAVSKSFPEKTLRKLSGMGEILPVEEFLLRIAVPSPLKARKPARVAIHGGMFTYATRNPSTHPYITPTRSISKIETPLPYPLTTIKTPPMAPRKHTKEPQERSMLPPVSIHINIPVASTNTYAFCVIRALKFMGENIDPPVITVKKIYTRTRMISIAFFLITSIYLLMTHPPLLFLLI